jgi:hypothetical protein
MGLIFSRQYIVVCASQITMVVACLLPEHKGWREPTLHLKNYIQQYSYNMYFLPKIAAITIRFFVLKMRHSCVDLCPTTNLVVCHILSCVSSGFDVTV